MSILEMEKLKKAYPIYKDIPDERLLQHIVKKYPVYAPIAKREFGEVKETGGLRTKLLEPAKKVAKFVEKVATPHVTGPVEGVAKAAKELERPFAAVRSLAAGKSPMEGFMKPETAPPFADSVLRAMEEYGLSAKDDPTQAFWVSAAGGYAMDLGTMHLAFNTIPKGVKEIASKVKGMYTGAQGKAYKSVVDALTREFKASGVEGIDADVLAKTTAWKTWQNAPNRSPSAMYKASAFLRSNEGKIAEMMKRSAKSAKVNAEAQGFGEDWVRKAADVGVKGLEMGPQTKLGKQMAMQMPATAAAIEAVPLHPAASGKEAMARIHKMLKPEPPYIPKGVEPPVVEGKAPVISKIEHAKAPAPTEAVTKYSPTSTFHTEYQTLAGPRKTLLTGTQLNDIETKIANNQIPTDSRGIPIVRILDTFGVKGDAGFANIEGFEDAFTNLMGEGEKVSSSFKQIAKKVGTPFFIGEKYPSFKPVYKAVQNGIDYKSELFFEGQHILQPHKLMKLPPSSQSKLADVVKLGNSPEIQRWYNDEELTTKFGFNPGEVEAYKRLKKLYNFGTQLEVKARKMFMDFEGMEPDKKLIAMEALNNQVAKLGGYVSQTRLGGQWAVFSPPDEEGGVARFFNLYKTKAEAQKVGGMIPNSRVYLRDDALRRGFHRHLTVADLENLIEASDARTTSPDVQALRDELRKRSFSSHWIQRKNVPGYEWKWDNIVESAVDYLEGASNKLARITGRSSAETSFRDSVKAMTPELRAYSRDFIDLFYNTGSIGIKGLNQLMYTYKLAFKTSWLAMNLAQPLSTTYPLGAKYFKGVENEKVFLKSYDMAWRYFMHRWKGTEHGISSELIGLLGKLHRQGALGDQMTRFQLAVKGLSQEQFDKWIGLFGRVGEGVNRAHAGIMGYFVADKLGLDTRVAKLEFMKSFIYKTQFAYGKHNLPQMVTSAGSARNLARTAYTFRHFTVSYMQLLNSFMPWRGGTPGQTTRALGMLTAQAGFKGLPFMALLALGYKLIRGRTMEHDIRAKAEEYDIPQKAVDVALGGVWSLAGIDSSMMIGVGDVIPTFGGTMGAVLGAPAGLGQQLYKAGVHAGRGEYMRALENATPDAIRNLLKARRYAVEGIRKMSGELIATPTKLDVALRGLGLTPQGESKSYAAREAKMTLRKYGTDKSSSFHRRIAKTIYDKDRVKRKEIIAELRAYNKRVPRENKVIINEYSIRNWLDKFKGRGDKTAPRKLKREYREIDKLFKAR